MTITAWPAAIIMIILMVYGMMAATHIRIGMGIGVAKKHPTGTNVLVVAMEEIPLPIVVLLIVKVIIDYVNI